MALKQQIFGVFQKLRTILPRGSNLSGLAQKESAFSCCELRSASKRTAEDPLVVQLGFQMQAFFRSPVAPLRFIAEKMIIFTFDQLTSVKWSLNSDSCFGKGTRIC